MVNDGAYYNFYITLLGKFYKAYAKVTLFIKDG